MSEYRISEVSRRTGFPTSTLRYYERVGLLPPPQRTASGYRVYEEGTLDRLLFIARGKQLGLALEDITELIALREGERCAPVRHQLHRLVREKLTEAETGSAELAAFAAELRAVARALAGDGPEGPCDDRCGCTAPVPAVMPVTLTEGSDSDRPVACTLAPEETRGRMDAWRQVSTEISRSETIEGGIRHVLEPGANLGALAELIAAEHTCCSFLAFALVVDSHGTLSRYAVRGHAKVPAGGQLRSPAVAS